MIYVASPYYDPDPSVIESRMEVVYEVMAGLMKEGNHCVSPMLMHPVVKKHDLPNTFDYWENYSYDMLKRCDEMLVIQLPGWEESRGVKAERDFCNLHNVPIDYLRVLR
jgi:hypothetical protein